MCLAVPGRVVALTDDRGTPMATIEVDGVTRDVCLVYLPEARVDDWVLVHAGFGIACVDPEAARAAIEDFRSLGAAGEEPER